MAELDQNKKITLTRFCVKTLFYLGNKSYETQLFTPILQNGCSKSIGKLARKAPS